MLTSEKHESKNGYICRGLDVLIVMEQPPDSTYKLPELGHFRGLILALLGV